MKIDPRQLVADIHAGITLQDLCRHHKLSESQFRAVFDRLVAAKLVTAEEFPEGPAPTPESESLLTTREIPSFTCPHCGMPQVAGTEVCCDCGVQIISYTPPKPEEKELSQLSFLMERVREHPAAAALIVVMFAVPMLVVFGFIHIWFEVRDDLRYGHMRNEIQGIRKHLEHGRYSLTDLRKMTRNYNKQLGKLKQRLEGSNPELIEVLEDAADHLRYAGDAWSNMIDVEAERGKGAAQGDRSFRDTQLDMFIYETNRALRMME